MTKTCFVVMGFNRKKDPETGRMIDLDKTYRGIIKPAVEAAGFKCERADEIQHAGTIDVPMYRKLLEADLVIADLSTLNPNAFFELGVRYALRSRRTIVIAESGIKAPFDINHVSMRFYEHGGEILDFEEVERFRDELTQLINDVGETEDDDSPVYTFLPGLVAPLLGEAEAAAPAKVEGEARPDKEGNDTYAVMIDLAMKFRSEQKFGDAVSILQHIVDERKGDVDPFVLHQLALATYKSELPSKEESLLAASDILKPLNPETALDSETIGLWGAIHKRLSELHDVGSDAWLEHLNTALHAYQRGYFLLQDYYNGINAAFLFDVRAHQSTGDDKIADQQIARRIRKHVITLTDDLLSRQTPGESETQRSQNRYWIEATKAEALFGLGQTQEATDLLAQTGEQEEVEDWMLDTTRAQIGKLGDVL